MAGAGCATRPPALTGPPPALPVPLPPLAVREINLRPPLLDLRLDLNWLDLNEFFPPGARRVGPQQPFTGELAPARRTRFPSAELCTSPDQRYILFHDGMKRGERSIFHWLMLLKKDALFPNTVFGTPLAFEASWAESSARFAVTHYVGHNASEVFVVATADLERRAIDLKPLIAAHFPPHLGAVPLFLKAYRWTVGGELIVRGIARAPEEPYELFGCEALVTFDGNGDEPAARYLRGYIKPQQGG